MTQRGPNGTIVLTVVMGLVIAAGLATSIDMSPLTEQLDIWTSTVEPTDFTIDTFDTKVQGQHKVTIDLTLRNTDGGAAHSGDVTVQILDANGTVLDEQTQATGDVAAGGTWSHSFSFQQTGLVAAYDSAFIVVDQTS